LNTLKQNYHNARNYLRPCLFSFSANIHGLLQQRKRNLKMKTGTIIRLKMNINNYPERDGYNWKYIYYKFCNGCFEIQDGDGGLMKFIGKHFFCLGTDYFVGLYGVVCGLELLEEDFEIVKKIPNKLIK